jgi:cytochrome c oxidase assembly protein subunit 11
MYLINTLSKFVKTNSTKQASSFIIKKLDMRIFCTIKKQSPILIFKLNNLKYLKEPKINKIFTTKLLFQNGQKPVSKINIYSKNYDSNSNTNAVWYILSGFVLMIGASYAAVPLFKIFCESTGMDVNTDFRDMNIESLKNKLASMKKVDTRNIEIKFVATTSSDLLWKFEPCQEIINVAPGETALAFFKAKNLTDRSIIGMATYTIVPFDAGVYFNKIQCFCFEEQRLEPNEEVDMPVFFYIDEDYAKDPKLKDVDQICLSYCFFESKGGEDSERIQKLRPY